MKTALLALIALTSLNTFAAVTKQTYEVAAPRVYAAPGGSKASDAQYCPQIKSFTVEQNENLDVVSMSVNAANGSIEVKYSRMNRTCVSDMVCPADDNFNIVGAAGELSLTRNNDGDYPTTDKLGYMHMKTQTQAPTKSGWVSCSYGIKLKN